LYVDDGAIDDVILDGHARTGVVGLLSVMIINLELDLFALGSCGPGYDGAGLPSLRRGSSCTGVYNRYTIAEVDIEALSVIFVPSNSVICIDVPHLIGVTRGAGISLNRISVNIHTVPNIKTLVAKNNDGAGRPGSGGSSARGDDP